MKVVAYFILSLFFLINSVKCESIPCQKRYEDSSFICVCNGQYCDEEDPIEAIYTNGEVAHILSDISENRFNLNTLNFVADEPTDVERLLMTVDKSKTFQEILGWGGAFTDAAGINIATLNEDAQDNLMKSYFKETGLGYNIGRTNIGGCDFSPRGYTYLDTPGDIALATFSLQEEDLVYKIPYMKKAQQYRSDLKIMGSPWTAPAWMKSNNNLIGQGFLLPEFYQVWADYLVRFVQEYENNDINIWGITAQNEPEDGNIPGFTFNCMGWNSSTQREFVVENLGPSLESAGYGDIKLMILDDQRPLAPKWTREVLSDPRAVLYVDGIAVHWYADDSIGLPHALDMTHEEFPDKFILYTEACNGDKPGQEAVILGNWHRGEKYLSNIIEDLNHWVVGWTDWNLALDLQGGPNWCDNYVDAPIIVNSTSNEFYKQPMFYALGHVSRYVSPGSIRVKFTEASNRFENLKSVAFQRPDNGIVVVLMNKDKEETRSITIYDEDFGYLPLDIEPSSMHTFVYWP